MVMDRMLYFCLVLEVSILHIVFKYCCPAVNLMMWGHVHDMSPDYIVCSRNVGLLLID